MKIKKLLVALLIIIYVSLLFGYKDTYAASNYKKWKGEKSQECECWLYLDTNNHNLIGTILYKGEYIFVKYTYDEKTKQYLLRGNNINQYYSTPYFMEDWTEEYINKRFSNNDDTEENFKHLNDAMGEEIVKTFSSDDYNKIISGKYVEDDNKDPGNGNGSGNTGGGGDNSGGSGNTGGGGDNSGGSGNSGGSNSGTGKTTTFTVDPNKYKTSASISSDSKVVDLTNRILGIINMFGVIILVIAVIVIGIKYMVGSVEQRADYKHTMVPILIGAIMLFSITTIINVTYKTVNSLSITKSDTQTEYNRGKSDGASYIISGPSENEIDEEIEKAKDNRDNASDALKKAYWEGYLYGLEHT